MKDLESLRAIIDQCDREIVIALEKRFHIANEIVLYKKENNISIFQPDREREVFKKINSYLNTKEFSNELKSVYTQIMNTSKEIQEKTRL